MSDLKDTCENNSEAVCNNRREFLVKAGVVAGGLMLSLSGAETASAKTNGQPADTTENLMVKLDEKSPLNKVGGSDTIDSKSGKIIVVRTGDMTFDAYSAVCPHKGGPIKYDADKKQLFCPWHKSTFDMSGKVTGGPAKQDLAMYPAQESVVVTLNLKS